MYKIGFATKAVLALMLLSSLAASAQNRIEREASKIGETYRPDVAEVNVLTWASGLDTPWSLVFLPDGRALVSERPGRIRLIVGGQVRAQPYLSVDSTVESGEGGLMGLALHPRFPDQAFVYAMQTFQNASGNLENRVIRLRHLGDRAEFDRVILDGIPGGRNHNGGRIAFGPDGLLYVGTGEVFQGELAQDRNSLGGKVLRVNPDGGIPADNPFPNSAVYTLGNRNPQGFAWHPQTGALFSSEHGPSGENGWRGHDELNLIVRGDNYGWPRVIGAPGRDGFDDPIVFWPDGAPPAGIAFWRGDLFMTTLRRQALVRVSLERSGQTYRATRLENWFASSNGQGRYGRLRDAVVGPDGALYVTTSNQDGRGSPRDGDDRILRIAPRN